MKFFARFESCSGRCRRLYSPRYLTLRLSVSYLLAPVLAVAFQREEEARCARSVDPGTSRSIDSAEKIPTDGTLFK